VRNHARFFALIVSMLLCAGFVAAQDSDDNGPATIVNFSADVAFLPLEQVEEGSSSVTLAWNAVGLNDDERLVLHSYTVDGYVPLLDNEEDPLPASGTREVSITSPATFSPPTYRLAILDFRNRVTDQRVVTIPYITPSGQTPEVELFAAAVSAVDADTLEGGNARINVTWVINDRPPTANPVFEQVMPDGSARLAELPRSVLWVPSSGSGVVAPVMPDGAGEIVLRLRLVDLADGTVYSEKELALPIGDVQQDAATESSTPEAAGDGEARIVSFSAVTQFVTLGDAAQLSWEVENAASVEVAVDLPDSDAQQVIAGNLPLRAGLTIPLGENTFAGMDTVTFTLRARDLDGEIVDSASVEISIVTAASQG
jgi:hypothetical protein